MTNHNENIKELVERANKIGMSGEHPREWLKFYPDARFSLIESTDGSFGSAEIMDILTYCNLYHLAWWIKADRYDGTMSLTISVRI